jgi:ATP-dependent DNA ligase
MKQFPMLYKKASTGKDLQWRIWSDGDTYFEEYGQIGGALIRTPGTKCKGKNIGRANETTAEEQASAEAQSKHESKLKRSGYVDTLEGARAGEESDLLQGGIWPQLAEKYRDYGDKLSWPCDAQRKYNGHRCIAIVKDGVCTLWSRKRNPILSVPHINRAIEALGHNEAQFDGELFDFELVRDKGLEALTHITRSSKPVAGHEVIKYHIYDTPQEALTWADRKVYLDKGLGTKPTLPLVRAETLSMPDIDTAMEFLEAMVDEGQEGIMLRDLKSTYLSHPTRRSKGLLKLKGSENKYDDGEFKVVGVEEGRGKMAGKAKFLCVTDKGLPFTAKMKGKLDNLVQYLEHPELAVGRMLTVQYIGWSKKGKPWMPVGLQFREDL